MFAKLGEHFADMEDGFVDCFIPYDYSCGDNYKQAAQYVARSE